jgi:hypothetical protein
MLHNTSKALYLQQWMKALEVQMDGPETTQEARGVKRHRPKVQRDVGNKRGRKRQRLSSDPFGGLDDFIADDEWDSNEDEDEDEEGYISVGDDLPMTSTVSSPISSRAVSPLPPPLTLSRGTRSRPSVRRIIDSPPPPSSLLVAHQRKMVIGTPEAEEQEDELVPFTARLTNTILLKGPCGSGKTAAVYACAEELKWKVFEFYPGIGKRSGSGFMTEVGGTGDNHRVGGTDKDQAGLKFPQTLGFLSSPSKKGTSEVSISGPSPDNNDVRQSLILVEEVDILYQSDGNLWPTLINFIRKSRRPVILTCNGTHSIQLSHSPCSHGVCLDVSLIPAGDIPLQAVLNFEKCDVELAASYLQAISIAEGHPIERNAAHDIYVNQAVYFPMEADIPDQPRLPEPSQGDLVLPDLKRSINHLQISLTTSRDIVGKREKSLGDFGNWLQLLVMPDPVLEIPDPHGRKRSPDEDLETVFQLSQLLDSISFGDAHVYRRMEVSLEVSSTPLHKDRKCIFTISAWFY